MIFLRLCHRAPAPDCRRPAPSEHNLVRRTPHECPHADAAARDDEHVANTHGCILCVCSSVGVPPPRACAPATKKEAPTGSSPEEPGEAVYVHFVDGQGAPGINPEEGSCEIGEFKTHRLAHPKFSFVLADCELARRDRHRRQSSLEQKGCLGGQCKRQSHWNASSAALRQSDERYADPPNPSNGQASQRLHQRSFIFCVLPESREEQRLFTAGIRSANKTDVAPVVNRRSNFYPYNHTSAAEPISTEDVSSVGECLPACVLVYVSAVAFPVQVLDKLSKILQCYDHPRKSPKRTVP